MHANVHLGATRATNARIYLLLGGTGGVGVWVWIASRIIRMGRLFRVLHLSGMLRRDELVAKACNEELIS